ncbi:MAG: TIGR00282 family metallophosphoesterase [Candidatus Omnitrophica bacterium]|nr:TIGR00282 family metallophosphoesterase [Candidatus Omnitrophota bacterium]MCM8799859.1 TIGR00282 family metallophosphoesterase [Candidatus Omnitrophota bacterium]
MNILFIGDIVGEPGRRAVKEILPFLKSELKLDFVIANAENAAGGSGITPRICMELLDYGIDVLTSGDHIWRKKEVFDIIDRERRLLRPLNFPPSCPGKGLGIYDLENKETKILVINLLGRVFMEPLDCPFRTITAELKKFSSQNFIIIVDIHAEATSEKVALGWYLDGLVSAVIGTHTHIQTADERVLPKGTAYITDVGMCGSFDSVIGRKIQEVINRFVSSLPQRFEVAEENINLQAVLIEIDTDTKKALSIRRIVRKI